MDRMRPLFLLLLAISGTRLLIAAENNSTTAPATKKRSAGLQANFGDVSFAGGMSYDSEHEIVYVTGQVGSHSCYVGILKRVAATTTRPTHLEFLSRQVFEERAICQTIAFRSDVSRPGNALLLSLSEEGGLLTDQREGGSRKATQYGGLLAMQYSTDGSSSEYHPDQSVLMYPAAVTIPRSITNDPIRTNRVFIATMTSDSSDIQYRDALGSPHVSEGGGGGVTTTPNLTPGGGMLKYGKNFAMTVASVRLATEFSGAEPQWEKPFGVKRDSDNVSKNGVTVNQIIFRKGSEKEDAAGDEAEHALYVVGSTLGSGPAFGEPEFDNDKGYGLVAGFITKLNPDTGGLTSSRRFLFDLNKGSESSENSLRDTYIEAVCASADDEDAIYIVGSYDRFKNVDRFRFLQSEWGAEDSEPETMTPTWTDTLSDTSDDEDDAYDDDDEEFEDDLVEDDFFDDDGMSTPDATGDEEKRSNQNTIGTPFIAKLRASTLETIWQKDFESTTNSRALGCGVDAESKTMYVAGNIEDGGEIIDWTTSEQGDDIFLMQLYTSDGGVSWSKQFGTTKDDRLAYGGNGLVVLEGQQGVLLMGDTTSNLYSISNQDSEMFIVEIDADGNLPDTTESTGIDNSPGAELVSLSNPMKVVGDVQSDVATDNKEKPDSTTNDNTTNDNTTNDKTPNDKTPNDSEDTSDPDDSKVDDSKAERSSTLKGHDLYIFMGACIVAFCFLGFYMHLTEKRKREATERALVFSYLQHFDLEDIDVKQAATGGWHGTYIGSLATGENRLNENISSSDGSWDTGNEFVEQKLGKMSHSSVVRDILFMDYDDKVFSSVDPNRNNDCDSDKYRSDDDDDNDIEHKVEETTGIVRDPVEFYDEDGDNGDDDDDDDDGPKPEVDPWGTEII